MKFLIPSILIALGIFIGVVYVVPQYEALTVRLADREEFSLSQEKIQETQQKYEEAIQWKDTIKQSDIRRLSEILPADFNNVQLLLDITNLAGTHGITLGPVITDTPIMKGGYVIHPLAFSFDAEYSSDAKEFMVDLEQSLTMFDVIDMTVVKKADTDVLTYTLTIYTYALH